jgi:hypothetical protein
MHRSDEMRQGEPYLSGSLEQYLALWDRRNGANVLYAMAARLIRVTDRLEEARGYPEESLRISRELGSRHDGAHALSELGQVARLAGECEEAGWIIASALAEFRDVGDRRCLSRMSTALRYVRERTGDVDEAGRLVADGIEASLPVTARPNLIRGRPILRCGRCVTRSVGNPTYSHGITIIAEAEDKMRLLLGRDEYEHAAAEGGPLSLEDAATKAERWLRNTTEPQHKRVGPAIQKLRRRKPALTRLSEHHAHRPTYRESWATRRPQITPWSRQDPRRRTEIIQTAHPVGRTALDSQSPRMHLKDTRVHECKEPARKGGFTVSERRLELPRDNVPLGPQPSASTNSATPTGRAPEV